MSALGEDFPKEQARLRELLRQYRSIGSAGEFGAYVIEDCLKRADKAAMSGDLVAMIEVYEEMKDFK